MNFKRISVAEFKQLLEEGEVQVIDIRDEQSYQQGHIPNSRHIHNANAQEFIAEANQESPLVVCCYHGNMSQSAAAYFSEQGFENACSLDGGYEAWVEVAAASE